MKDDKSAAAYYQKLGSRIGYRLVMKRSQHFGYYDEKHNTEESAQANYHQKFIELLRLNPGMKVLDAGCGQGVVAVEVALKYDVFVKGITITPHEVISAQKRAAKAGVNSKVTFSVQDYAKTNFADNTFDRIYTTESLSHAKSVKRVVQEFYRILKPGGLLVCAEYEMDYKNFDDETKRLAELIRVHASIYAIYQFGKGEFENDLMSEGFKIKDVIDWTDGVKPSFDRLRRLAKPFAKIVKSIKLEHKFVNVTAAAMYANGVEDNVFAYKVYISKKQ